MGRERQIFKDEVFKLSDSENEDGPSTFQPRKERKNMQKRKLIKVHFYGIIREFQVPMRDKLATKLWITIKPMMTEM
jgi:hypothetical protein